MRIISDFHDYYDCIQSTGQDQDTIWVRKSEKIKKFPFPIFPGCGGKYWRIYTSIEFTEYIVGFCGKIYPIIEGRNSSKEKTFCHSVSDINKFIEKNCTFREVESYYSKKFRMGYRSPHPQKKVKEFFTKCDLEKEKYNQLFLDNHCPVFVAQCNGHRNREIVINGNLKSVEFYRVVEPYTAYQEIFMYFSGVLSNPVKEIPTISDEIMRDSKGFDRWSFKKPPTKRN